MQHLETDTGSSDPYLESGGINCVLAFPLRSGTAPSQNPGISASGGNPVSYVQADSRNNKPSILPDWEPWPNLGPDGYGSETLVN